jgi:flagellar biosynthetic protein FlhB
LAEDSSQDKELDPTAQRLQKARDEGQFAQSRDITTFALITGFLLFVIVLGPMLFRQMLTMVDLALRFNQPIRLLDHISDWGSGPFTILALTIAMVMLPIWIIAIFAPLALAGFRPVFALKFAPDKLNPIAGIGRMFSTNSLIELGKNLIKILLILGVGFAYLYGLFAYVKSIIAGDFNSSILITTGFIVNGITLLLIPLAVIALTKSNQQISFWFWQATEITYHLGVWQYLAGYTGASFGLPSGAYAIASILRVVGLLTFTYFLLREISVRSTVKSG